MVTLVRLLPLVSLKKSKISGKVAAKSDKIPWINSKNNIGDVQITSVNIYSEKEVLSINVENPKTNYVTETTNIIQFLNEVSCNVKFQFKTNLLQICSSGCSSENQPKLFATNWSFKNILNETMNKIILFMIVKYHSKWLFVGSPGKLHHFPIFKREHCIF